MIAVVGTLIDPFVLSVTYAIVPLRVVIPGPEYSDSVPTVTAYHFKLVAVLGTETVQLKVKLAVAFIVAETGFKVQLGAINFLKNAPC